MNEVEAIEVGRDAIFVMLQTAGPVMAMALVVGLAISLFQALTSIQEMTLTFVPKILVIFASVMVLLPYMLSKLTEFTVLIFDRVIALG